MGMILQYLKPYLSKMAGGLSIKFIGTVMDLFLPWILAYMIDNVVPMKQMGPIWLCGAVMAVCAILAVTMNIAANRMAAAVARDATRTIRHDLFAKISLLSCAQIDKMTIPSLVSRLSSDTYNLHRMISTMQRMGIRAPILLLGGILITLTLDPMLTLIMVATLPFTVLVIVLVSRIGIPMYTKLQGAVDTMVRVVRENASGIRIIKALSKAEYEKARFAEANTEVSSREQRANVVMGITNPVMFLILNLGLVVVLIVGASRVNAGQTQPGAILAFLTYFTIILNATLSITRMFVMFSRGSASGERIAEVLALPEDLTLHNRDHRDNGYHIAFERVSFSYYSQSSLLEDISFSLKRGETLGILGEIGSGKSTVLQLLLRFYDPTAGTIRINGDDIRGIPPDELYPMFGIAFQKDVLFADTIRENIDFGRQLTEEQLRAAVTYAQADQFVDTLEEGLDYDLSSRGTNLSGGQRQRLLIARALAAPAKTGASGPEILILDDSSSALDYRTDANLRQSLGEHFSNTTTIIVAQRISSIKQADHILVLEQGRILGYGAHDELLLSCALYQELYQSQMGGGIQESEASRAG
ncbi:multidrug ABC transporter ATP-binding protein [Spirochaetia bacterium]|nr:multidrug ABC transporter ATP-binding protein [Spirochaetia bacterium]